MDRLTIKLECVGDGRLEPGKVHQIYLAQFVSMLTRGMANQGEKMIDYDNAKISWKFEYNLEDEL